jgi:5-methylcytosine-specific restriction endonuclease McrA
LLAAEGSHTAAELVEAWAAYDDRCWMCGAPATCTDHFIPISRGGSDDKENLRPACTPCNASKGARLPDEL